MTRQPRRVRIDLAYDGTSFSGWQVQARARTVQGVLEGTLTRIQGQGRVDARGAGRTDAGVHARGQVADAWVATRLDDGALLRALSSLLPDDLRPLALRTVADSFHSRRDAVSKTYRYVLDRSGPGDPLLARYSLHHPHPLSPGDVRDALLRLPGRRDWSGFAGAACEVQDRVRTLLDASLEEAGSRLTVFSFTADGFLTHMVRNLVGTLLEIGRGRFAPDRVDRILEAGDRRLAGPTAPARGLFLDRVRYAGEEEPELLAPWPPGRGALRTGQV